METPNFGVEQFVDSASLNTASATTTSNLAILGTTMFRPGLVYPEVTSIAFTGLTAAVSLPAPFGLIFGSGVLSQAHGTTTNQDTQTYSVPFSGVVPASGTTTAYLLASYQQIQQGPIQIIGPPPGHPDYDPAFVPYTSYLDIVDSIALTASTTAADNLTTFELLRCTMTAAVSGVTNVTTAYQNRSPSRLVFGTGAASGVTGLSGNAAPTLYQTTVSGIYTLPSAAEFNGCFQALSCISTGTATVLANGADVIYGVAGVNGVTNFSLSGGEALLLMSIFGSWQVLACSLVSATNAAPLPTCELGANGYIKTPNSGSPAGYLIEQFGESSTVGGTVNVIFPTAFPTAALAATAIVAVTQTGPGPSGNDTVIALLSSITTTGMTVLSPNASTISFNYRILGY